MEEYVLICEDSMEGILSGIYEAYQYKKEMGIEHHESIHLAVKVTPSLSNGNFSCSASRFLVM